MISLLLLVAFAIDIPGQELYIAQPEPTPEIKTQETQKTVRKKSESIPSDVNGTNRNLPDYYTSGGPKESPVSELVTKPPGSVDIFRALKVGDIIESTVQHSVIAFRDEKAPVLAISETGRYRGLRFIGQSNLEPNSRRIFVTFDRIVVNGQIFKTNAVGVTISGQPGLLGKYYTREEEYFAGDFISSFVAGYFDGLVPRKTNVFGYSETHNSVDSAVKKGLASGALSSAERFREKLKKVPEFSEIKGPFNLKVMILENAISNN